MLKSTDFSYDGVQASSFGLQIASFSADTIEENESFTREAFIMKAPQLERFHFGGVSYTAPPTCQFQLVSQTRINTVTRQQIMRWLFGPTSFTPLTFVDGDIACGTCYCLFTGCSVIYVNGVCHGFNLTAMFDSPYVRDTRRWYANNVPTNGNSQTRTYNFVLQNNSDYSGFIYPKITFNGDIEIVHTDVDDVFGENDRVFSFSGIEPPSGEERVTITVDGETKTITSSDGKSYLDRFNGRQWLRLGRGNNGIRVIARVGSSFEIEWNELYMIGF